MALEKCPKCGNESLIKTPHAKIMNEKWGSMKHVADEHSMDCLNKECKYTSGVIRIKVQTL